MDDTKILCKPKSKTRNKRKRTKQQDLEFLEAKNPNLERLIQVFDLELQTSKNKAYEYR